MKLSRTTLLACAGIALCVALAIATMYWDSLKDDRGPVRIGFVIAMTGYGAPFGAAQADAVELLRERYPTHKFLIEDSKSDPKSGLSAVRKLIDVDNVDIVYCDLTTVANAIAPITDRERKLLIATVYLRDLLERTPLALRNLPTAAEEARLVLNHVKQAGGSFRRVMALGSNDEFGRGAIADFKSALAAFDGILLREDFIPDNEQQIASFASRIIVDKPDNVYIASLQPSLGLLIRQLRLAGFSGPVMTTDAYAYDYIRNAAGPEGKGTVYVDFSGSQRTTEFSSAYEKRFRRPFSPVAGLAYDGVSFVLDGAKDRVRKLDAQSLAALGEYVHQGVLGEVRLVNREFKYALVVRVAR